MSKRDLNDILEGRGDYEKEEGEEDSYIVSLSSDYHNNLQNQEVPKGTCIECADLPSLFFCDVCLYCFFVFCFFVLCEMKYIQI